MKTRQYFFAIALILSFSNLLSMKLQEDYDIFLERNDGDPQKALFDAVEKGLSHFIDRLVKDGAKVNICDKNRITPLTYAIMNRDISSLAKLQTHGADVNTDSSCLSFVIVDNGQGEVPTLLTEGTR